MQAPSATLTSKEIQIIAGKTRGKKQRQIATEVFPNLTPGSAQVAVTKILKKANVQAALEASMIRVGINLDKALLPIAKALIAKDKEVRYKTTTSGKGKDKVVTTEPIVIETDNIPLQLQGSDRARELLGIGKNKVDTLEPADLTPSELQILADTSDEVELTRLVFRKT